MEWLLQRQTSVLFAARCCLPLGEIDEDHRAPWHQHCLAAVHSLASRAVSRRFPSPRAALAHRLASCSASRAQSTNVISGAPLSPFTVTCVFSSPMLTMGTVAPPRPCGSQHVAPQGCASVETTWGNFPRRLADLTTTSDHAEGPACRIGAGAEGSRQGGSTARGRGHGRKDPDAQI